MPRSPSGRLPSRPWARVRRAALDRDEWRCCRCGSPVDLEVHHRRPVAVAPSLAFVLANVETVCRECHLVSCLTITLAAGQVSRGCPVSTLLASRPMITESKNRTSLVQFRPGEANAIAGRHTRGAP